MNINYRILFVAVFLIVLNGFGLSFAQNFPSNFRSNVDNIDNSAANIENMKNMEQISNDLIFFNTTNRQEFPVQDIIESEAQNSKDKNFGNFSANAGRGYGIGTTQTTMSNESTANSPTAERSNLGAMDDAATSLSVSTTNYDSQIGENISGKNLTVTLTAEDIAYPISNPKYFTFTIKNTGQTNYTVNLSDDYVHNVFLDIYDEYNVPVENSPDLLLRRANSYVSYRSIILFPSEDFSITVNIDDFANIAKVGVYSISAKFYPEKHMDISQQEYTKKKFQRYANSNNLLVSVVNDNTFKNTPSSNYNQYTDIYKNSKLIIREYSPYDVVQAALSALQKTNWDEFFYYVDIKDLYINSETTTDTFNLLTLQEQQVEIVQFVKRIRSGKEIHDLYTPNMFTIDETRFSDYNANVSVSARVTLGFDTQLFRYNFVLKNKDSGWKITNYTVKFLGVVASDTERAFLGTIDDYYSPTEFR